MRHIAVVALVAVVAVFVIDACHNRSVSEWEQRVARVEEQVAHERARAEALKQEAAESAGRADSLAVELARRAPEIRERIIEVQIATPDSLRNEPAIVQRDSLIADLRNESDGWREAYEEKSEAYALLAEALRYAESSRDSLLAVLKDRPGERPWYVPSVGVGPFAGVCSNGSTCAGPVAVSLTWRIRL
jgi:chromosome segregation ATPase